MDKTQFLREAAFQRKTRLHRQSTTKNAGNLCASAQVLAGIACMSEWELKMYKAQIAKQLIRERRLHRAHSYLYSASRHIQLYAAYKTLESV